MTEAVLSLSSSVRGVFWSSAYLYTFEQTWYRFPLETPRRRVPQSRSTSGSHTSPAFGPMATTSAETGKVLTVAQRHHEAEMTESVGLSVSTLEEV